MLLQEKNVVLTGVSMKTSLPWCLQLCPSLDLKAFNASNSGKHVERPPAALSITLISGRSKHRIQESI
jgi:hypothetical protein